MNYCNEYIVGHCCECDDETLYKNHGNTSYIDKICKRCGGTIYIDPQDTIKIPVIPKESKAY